MIFEIFKKKDVIILGKVHRELRLQRRFGVLRWHWKRRYFKRMKIDTLGMLNQHVMITGESGAGKSNVCKLILRQLVIWERTNFEFGGLLRDHQNLRR